MVEPRWWNPWRTHMAPMAHGVMAGSHCRVRELVPFEVSTLFFRLLKAFESRIVNRSSKSPPGAL